MNTNVPLTREIDSTKPRRDISPFFCCINSWTPRGFALFLLTTDTILFLLGGLLSAYVYTALATLDFDETREPEEPDVVFQYRLANFEKCRVFFSVWTATLGFMVLSAVICLVLTPCKKKTNSMANRVYSVIKIIFMSVCMILALLHFFVFEKEYSNFGVRNSVDYLKVVFFFQIIIFPLMVVWFQWSLIFKDLSFADSLGDIHTSPRDSDQAHRSPDKVFEEDRA